jgi:hypothetical protein
MRVIATVLVLAGLLTLSACATFRGKTIFPAVSLPPIATYA